MFRSRETRFASTQRGRFCSTCNEILPFLVPEGGTLPHLQETFLSYVYCNIDIFGVWGGEMLAVTKVMKKNL